MSLQMKNNAAAHLAADITTSDTTITLKTGEGANLPAITTAGTDYFYLTLVDASGNREIVEIVNRATDTLTVGHHPSATADVAGRGADDTTARSFDTGDVCECRMSLQVMEDMWLEAYCDPAELLKGGSDELDGDKIQILMTPTNFTPDSSPPQVTSTQQLTAFLKGIDNALGGTGFADEDGDILDIDFTPTNYDPDDSAPEASDVDDLAAHLKGIDTALALSFKSYARIEHQESYGTAGGSLTGGPWTACPYNTIVDDDDSIVSSLSSNRLVLAAGKYLIKANHVVYNFGGRLRLYNYTADSRLLLADGTTMPDNANSSHIVSVSGVVTLAANQSLGVDLYGRDSITDGLGQATSSWIDDDGTTVQDVEIYGAIEIFKIS